MPTAEQRRNAQIIIGVGQRLGASSRDIMIALMTAYQESGLRNLNYGHLDSVGLFQQRNAWGSFAARTNPAEAARMFFQGGRGGQRGLFDFRNRNRMSLTQAAQAVQVSAFPNAYAKWEDEARDLLGSVGGVVPSGGGGGFIRPVQGGRVSQEQGRPNSRYASGRHTGVDFAVPSGTPVYAAGSGTVVAVGGGGAYGTRIEIAHQGKIWTLYAHLSRAQVRVGQRVSAGQQIGLSGTSGNSSGAHLHFEMRQGKNRYGNDVDPMRFLNTNTTPTGYVENVYNETTSTVRPSMGDLLSTDDELEQVAIRNPLVYQNPFDYIGSDAPVSSPSFASMTVGYVPQTFAPETATPDLNLEPEPLDQELPAATPSRPRSTIRQREAV